MKFKHHTYTWSKPFLSVRHKWTLVGPIGAVHFHASIHEGTAACGLEFHHTDRALLLPRFSPMTREAPAHLDCELTGGRCWHDGTSLYAMDTLWPRFELYLKGGHHEEIFRSLEKEYEDRFERDGD